MGSSPTRGSSFYFGKVTSLSVLCCFALFVWPCLLLSSFLLHLSLKHTTHVNCTSAIACFTEEVCIIVLSQVEAAVALQYLIKSQKIAEDFIHPYVKPIIQGFYTMYMYVCVSVVPVHLYAQPIARRLIFFGKVTTLGVLYCFALLFV